MPQYNFSPSIIPREGEDDFTQRTSGIVLALYSGNANWATEIERAPDNSGTPDTANSISLITVDRETSVYTDPLPIDNNIYYYRTRHITAIEEATACLPSDWTDWSQGYKASLLPSIFPTPPTLDFVRIIPDYSQPNANTGRLKLTVKDPQSYVTAVEYQLKEINNPTGADGIDYVGTDGTVNTWFSTWDSQNGTTGVNKVVDYTQDVVLNSKRSHGIKWRVTYTDIDGEQQQDIGAFNFDIDQIPNVTFSLSIFGTSAYLSWSGDEDTESIRYLVHESPDHSSVPTAQELTDSGICVNGDQHDGVEVATNLTSNDEIYIRVRGYSGANCAGKVSITDWSTRLTYPSGTSGIPHVYADYDQTGATGTTNLTIIDPSGVVTATDFRDKIGKDAWEAFPTSDRDASSPFNAVHTTAIDVKHNSSVQWRVEYTGIDENGDEEVQYVTGSHTFDIDNIPEAIFSVSIFGDELFLAWTGDEDVESVRYIVQVNPDPDNAPTETELTNSGTNNNSDEHEGLNIAQNLSAGDKIYIRARSYNEDNAGGTLSSKDFQLKLTYPLSTARIPHVYADYDQTGATGTTNLTIIDPSGVVTATDFRDKIGKDAWEAFPTSDRDASSPFNAVHTTAIDVKHNSSVQWRVEYTGIDENGDEEVQYVTGSHTFDIDNIPEAIFSVSIFGDELFLAWTGDEDVESVRYIVQVNPDPDNAPTETELTNSGTNNNSDEHEGLNIAQNLSAGDKIYIRARSYNEDNAGGTLSSKDFQLKLTYPLSTARIPHVYADYDQTGATGTTNLTIIDPSGVVTATDFRDKIGKDAWEAFPTSDRDENSPFNLSHSTLINAKHNSSVQWRVEYTGLDESGGEETQYITGVHTFDIDNIPEANFFIGIFNDELSLAWTGDEDVESVRYIVQVNPDPDNAPTETELTNSGINNNSDEHEGLRIVQNLVAGDKIYLRARAYTEDDAGGNSSSKDFTAQLTYPDAMSRVPVVQESYTQDGATGTATLVLIDPIGSATKVNFIIREDTTAWGAWPMYAADDSLATTHTQEVALSPKHNSGVQWRVYYDTGVEGNDAIAYVTGGHTFDIDLIPEAVFSASIFGDEAIVSWVADEDSQSVRIRAVKNPTGDIPPTASDLTTNGTAYNSQRNDGEIVLTGLVSGDKLFFRARAYNDTAQDSDSIMSIRDWAYQTTVPDSGVPSVSAEYTQSGSNGTTRSYCCRYRRSCNVGWFSY